MSNQSRVSTTQQEQRQKVLDEIIKEEKLGKILRKKIKGITEEVRQLEEDATNKLKLKETKS